MSYNNTYISNQNLNLLDEIENQIQNITGLPNLESIDNISIPSTVWPFVSTMNQNLSYTSSPTFELLTLNGTGVFPNNNALIVTGNILPGITGYGNIGYFGNHFNSIFADNIYGTIDTPSQGGINILPNLTSVQGIGIPSGAWNYVSNMNQNVSSNSGPTFDHVTCNNLYGQLQGIQTGITGLPHLYSIQNVSIPTGSWNYVANMNQNISTSSSPNFSNILISNNTSSQTITTNQIGDDGGDRLNPKLG